MGVKEKLVRAQKVVYEDFWALKGVSFSLEPGDSLAVIGPNGSGKSTLLKCLAGTLTPDRGSVEIGGKVAGLLELGAGFHPDLTGKENIYLNGSILGMKRREIDDLYDRIVEFAGVAEFIDNPVRNFSSGMYVRLGFAIAIQVDPDVLLLDEILAVGDAEFQAKCFEKLHETRRRGRTVLLVTHDTQSAMRMCERAILLDQGRVIAEGACRDVVALYQQRVMAQRDAEPEEVPSRPSKRWGTSTGTIRDVELLDEAGRPVERVATGESCVLRVTLAFAAKIEDPIVGMQLAATDGRVLFGTNTLSRGMVTGVFEPGDAAEVVFRQELGLLPGRYMFSVGVVPSDASEPVDYWRDCLHFRITGPTVDNGYVDLGTRVELTRLPAETPEPQRPPQVLNG
jgi:ABC-2 type transport system ATP-binding protein